MVVLRYRSLNSEINSRLLGLCLRMALHRCIKWIKWESCFIIDRRKFRNALREWRGRASFMAASFLVVNLSFCTFDFQLSVTSPVQGRQWNKYYLEHRGVIRVGQGGCIMMFQICYFMVGFWFFFSFIWRWIPAMHDWLCKNLPVIDDNYGASINSFWKGIVCLNNYFFLINSKNHMNSHSTILLILPSIPYLLWILCNNSVYILSSGFQWDSAVLPHSLSLGSECLFLLNCSHHWFLFKWRAFIFSIACFTRAVDIFSAGLNLWTYVARASIFYCMNKSGGNFVGTYHPWRLRCNFRNSFI